MVYKLFRSPITNEIKVVHKIEEGSITSIPFSEDNTDYQEYLEWVAEGNTPQEAD